MYAQKSSSLNSVFVHRNRVLWTRFLFIEIESSGLDLLVSSHSINNFWSRGYWAGNRAYWTRFLWMVPNPPHVAVGPNWDLFSSLPVSSTLTPSALSIFSSLTTFLSYLTQHLSQVMFLQYCDYLLFFFKKNLEHIRKSHVFFFFFSV